MSVVSCPLSLSLICRICSNPYIGPDHSKHSAPFWRRLEGNDITRTSLFNALRGRWAPALSLLSNKVRCGRDWKRCNEMQVDPAVDGCFSQLEFQSAKYGPNTGVQSKLIMFTSKMLILPNSI